VYQTESQGRHHELGTSGFLYRSNKLMYDHATKSFWSTMQGEPVVGSLADEDIMLKRHPVVTTTWGEWKRRHPDTTVLSILTGHNRDYGEGIAYGKYFANQKLMFAVPAIDDRLQNKDEVVALRNGDEQLAVSTDYLAQHPVFQDSVGEQAFVILTDSTGANRVYESGNESGNESWATWDGKETAVDGENRKWTVTEDTLTDSTGQELRRLPAHRAFWFGWYSQFPETRLVK